MAQPKQRLPVVHVAPRRHRPPTPRCPETPADDERLSDRFSAACLTSTSSVRVGAFSSCCDGEVVGGLAMPVYKAARRTMRDNRVRPATAGTWSDRCANERGRQFTRWRYAIQRSGWRRRRCSIARVRGTTIRAGLEPVCLYLVDGMLSGGCEGCHRSRRREVIRRQASGRSHPRRRPRRRRTARRDRLHPVGGSSGLGRSGPLRPTVAAALGSHVGAERPVAQFSDHFLGNRATLAGCEPVGDQLTKALGGLLVLIASNQLAQVLAGVPIVAITDSRVIRVTVPSTTSRKSMPRFDRRFSYQLAA